MHRPLKGHCAITQAQPFVCCNSCNRLVSTMLAETAISFQLLVIQPLSQGSGDVKSRPQQLPPRAKLVCEGKCVLDRCTHTESSCIGQHLYSCHSAGCSTVARSRPLSYAFCCELWHRVIGKDAARAQPPQEDRQDLMILHVATSSGGHCLKMYINRLPALLHSLSPGIIALCIGQRFQAYQHAWDVSPL